MTICEWTIRGLRCEYPATEIRDDREFCADHADQMDRIGRIVAITPAWSPTGQGGM